MKKITLILFVIGAWLIPSGGYVFGCNVCHSKNPRMVRMHEELGFKDCFRCHGQGLEKTAEGKQAQMTGDGRCIPCHKK